MVSYIDSGETQENRERLIHREHTIIVKPTKCRPYSVARHGPRFIDHIDDIPKGSSLEVIQTDLDEVRTAMAKWI